MVAGALAIFSDGARRMDELMEFTREKLLRGIRQNRNSITTQYLLAWKTDLDAQLKGKKIK